METKSCDTLLKTGHTASGYYFIDSPRINYVHQYELAKCNMEKEPSDPLFQENTGLYINKHIPVPIAFDVKRDSSYYGFSGTVISFEQALTNNGNAMTTSGVFKRPVKGIYQFSFVFNNIYHSEGSSWVSIRVDNREVAKVWGMAGYDSVSEVVVLSLNANQTVDAFMKQGGIDGRHHGGGGDSDVHFTGHMLFRM